MKKIILFAGSNSSKSINQQLIRYTATLIDGQSAEVIDLRDYDTPIYSSDIESESGIPDSITAFKSLIEGADAFVISLAEHNGNTTAFFKNMMDWLSRAEMKAFGGKPVLLMSSSPGKGGAQSALASGKKALGYMAANIEYTYSLGGFYDKFDSASLILTDAEEQEKLKLAIDGFVGQM